ncbi:MAG: murein L,D-transpeptidase catalytic domain-containing protein [Croceibacterium sp.]
MVTRVDRRHFLASAGAATGASLLPARAFAQPVTLSPRASQIMAIARREVARAGAVLWRRDIAGILDFGLHSAMPRFHFANLDNGTVQSFRVAHGLGSDAEHDGWLKQFSNQPGSYATSRGAYITWEWYTGKYGTSVRLGGLDPDNSHAFDRALVMHPAQYCTEEHVQKWGKLGRSNGCFAMAPGDFLFALAQLSGGRLLYADALGIGPDGEHIARPAFPAAPAYASGSPAAGPPV